MIPVKALALAALLHLGAANAQEQKSVVEYAAGTLAPTDYKVIAHLQADSWLTVFAVPSHKDANAAREALLKEAARRGGDGVINVRCLSGGVAEGVFLRGHYCYGSVIRRVQ
jgi:hypothetical protein